MKTIETGVSNNQIKDQIDQLFSSILIEQQKFDSIKESDPNKAQLMKDLMDSYTELKGRGLFYDYFSTGRGHGPFTELVDGSVKYDLINGIGYNILGHSHPVIIKAALESATVDTMMVGNLQSYSEPYELSKIILDQVKETPLKHIWFGGSGSFVNDMAIKILWQKASPKYEIISFQKAFAGRSIGTQEITANEAYRVGQPTLMKVHHVPHWDQNDPENSTQKTIEALDKLYDERGDVFCCLTLELIQGEGGFIFGTREYYETVFEWARSKGIYIWIDEVQTFSRTQELFAFKMFGLEKYADICTIAKAMQGAAVLYSEELNPKPGLIAGTFNGSVPALKAGAKVVRYLTEGPFYGAQGRIKEIEEQFLGNLKRLSETSCKGLINYCGGVGTMISFEVGNAGKDETLDFVKHLLKDGIIAFIAGKNPTRVRFLLPVCLTDEHIEDIFQILEKSILKYFKK